MSKSKLILVVLSAAFLLLVVLGLKMFGGKANVPGSDSTALTAAVNANNATLSIIFDNGIKVNYSKDVKNNKTSVFDMLKETTDANSIKMEFKKYDFGTMVESIAGAKNGKEMSWIYFVNGNSGTVAADKYLLQPGDKVEWKYIKPAGE